MNTTIVHTSTAETKKMKYNKMLFFFSLSQIFNAIIIEFYSCTSAALQFASIIIIIVMTIIRAHILILRKLLQIFSKSECDFLFPFYFLTHFSLLLFFSCVFSRSQQESKRRVHIVYVCSVTAEPTPIYELISFVRRTLLTAPKWPE